MSSDGLLSLRWNNHHISFMQALSTLRNQESYSDITLACAGKFYSVHKLVLSTCSDYFVQIMNRTPCKHPIIVLKDIRHQDLEALLNYMYLGEVNVVQSELASLIKAAECLKIKGLAVPDEPPHPEEDSKTLKVSYENEKKNKKRRCEDDDTVEFCSTSKKSHRGTSDISEANTMQGDEVNTDEGGTTTCENQQRNEKTVVAGCTNQLEPILIENTVIKEEGELKYEDEDGVPITSSNKSIENQIADSGLASHGSELSAESGEQIKYQNSLSTEDGGDSLNPNITQQQYLQPQSFEEIVSQALPGSSLQNDAGQSWDGMQSKRDSTSFFSPHHRSLQPMGQARSGWGRLDISGQPLLHQPSNVSRDVAEHHTYHRTNLEANPCTSHDDAAQHQPSDKLVESIDKRCCQVCGYTGQDVSQLRKHLRIHTGEKPYRCHKCDYSSAQSSNLKVHMKRHHFDPNQQEVLRECQVGSAMEMPRERQYLGNDTILLD